MEHREHDGMSFDKILPEYFSLVAERLCTVYHSGLVTSSTIATQYNYLQCRGILVPRDAFCETWGRDKKYLDSLACYHFECGRKSHL
jgi:hypothetical protein